MYILGNAPPEVAKHIFLPDIAIDETVCWMCGDRPQERLSTAVLADISVQMFLDLCERAQRGGIDTTSEIYKNLQRYTRHEYD